MKIHTLRTDAEPFEAVARGKKQFEFRKDDRNFMPGDFVVLEEVADGILTGREIEAFVPYLLAGGNYGVPVGYVVLSLDVTDMRL